MLELLKSEYPIIQLLALKTLGVITNDKEPRVMLRDNQGLDHLLKILEAKVFSLCGEACLSHRLVSNTSNF
jgi:hypothetical protein